MVSGQYSLRDMYEQFQQISKMGPLSKVILATDNDLSFIINHELINN